MYNPNSWDVRAAMNVSGTGALQRQSSMTMALPVDKGIALYPQTQHHHQHHQNHRRRRLFGCGDEDVNCNNNNNNNNYSSSSNDRSPTYIDNTTLLVDELEGLRNDNFQLRLRVYNAEQRVDELTADSEARNRVGGGWCCHRCGGEPPTASCSADSDTGASERGSSVDNYDESENAAAMASMAKSAVRTINDLMTVNRRLIALLNAVLSAKPVSKSDEDDRRWQTLRNQIKEYCDVGSLALQGEGVRQPYDDEDHEYDDDTESEDENTEPIIVTEPELKVAPLVSPTDLTVTTTLAANATLTATTNATNDDDSADNEMARLRARCQQLELSIQQLVNTELWARNRQIGKLEQQRCVALEQQRSVAQQQQQPNQRKDAVAVASPAVPQQRMRPVATSTPGTVPRGILVRPRKLTPSGAQLRTAAPSMKSPPPVLPDYSEVNFFFSCDEEDDQLDLELDANDVSSSSVSNEDTESDDEREAPARLRADCGTAKNNKKATGDANNNRPRKRQSWRRYRHQYPKAGKATSSSAESVEMTVDDLNGDTTSLAMQTAARRPIQAGSLPHHRPRRPGPPSGRNSSPPTAPLSPTSTVSPSNTLSPTTVLSPITTPVIVAVADAQVQCDHVDTDDQAQVRQLRRELEARRRENSRLYEMLLKLQRKDGVGDGGVKVPSSTDPKVTSPRETKSSSPPHRKISSPAPDAASLDSDTCDSPEPYRQAARAVRGRIADLLPPLLMRSAASGSPPSVANSPPRDSTQTQQQQQQHRGSTTTAAGNGDSRQQQQMHVLNRLRDRIVEYERQVLLGDEDAGTTAGAATSVAKPGTAVDSDAENAEVRRMDRAALVNVALPRVVDRFRRVLQVQQQRPAASVTLHETTVSEVLEPQLLTVGDDDRECNLRRRRQPNRAVER